MLISLPSALPQHNGELQRVNNTTQLLRNALWGLGLTRSDWLSYKNPEWQVNWPDRWHTRRGWRRSTESSRRGVRSGRIFLIIILSSLSFIISMKESLHTKVNWVSTGIGVTVETRRSEEEISLGKFEIGCK